MKQKKLIFNFFVNRNWKKLADSRKRAKILADNRKSHHPIQTLVQVGYTVNPLLRPPGAYLFQAHLRGGGLICEQGAYLI